MKTFRIACTETATVYYDVQAANEKQAQKIISALNDGSKNIADMENDGDAEYGDLNDDSLERKDWRLIEEI